MLVGQSRDQRIAVHQSCGITYTRLYRQSEVYADWDGVCIYCGNTPNGEIVKLPMSVRINSHPVPMHMQKQYDQNLLTGIMYTAFHQLASINDVTRGNCVCSSVPRFYLAVRVYARSSARKQIISMDASPNIRGTECNTYSTKVETRPPIKIREK